MSEDGETQPSGAPPGRSAPFEVLIADDGSASIDGEPVPVIGDQPLDIAILDTLHGYAQLRDTPVTAAISNPSTGYAVRIEVGPDGSSQLLAQDAGSDAGGGTPAASGPSVPAGDAMSGVPGQEGPSPQGPPPQGPSPQGPSPQGPSGSDKRRVAMPSIPRPSIPRPSLSRPSLSRLSASRRSPGAGKAGARGSDEEFRPSSLLKKPWTVAAAAVALAALITTPIALAGSGGEEKESGKDRKNQASGTKDDAGRGPSGTVRPSPPGYPTDSPSGSPSSDPSSKDKDKDKDPTGEPKPSPSESGGSADDEDSAGAPESPGGSDDGDDDVDAAGTTAKIPSGATMVVNRKSNRCLDLPGTGGGKPDGRVQQGPCDTTPGSRGGNQRWVLDLKKKGAGPRGTDLYLVRNVKDDLCLDLAAFGPVAAGSPVTEFHCRADEDNQLWWLDKRSNGTFSIRNEKSGNLCLNVANAGKANAAATISGCDGAVRQWSFRKP
ncbi:RICIN domain-containing protein [Streptomyces sp. 8N114]|uniref:RICIN domain-containing protein n=1 Tax=Streptomyces sp. 8N114 TaxID=3457419 RepID=UPI003FD4956F